jgi:hypothetical protein
MKNSIIRNIMFIIFAGVIISSCEKDEDPENDLLGTWTSGAATFNATVNDMPMTQYFTDSLGLTSEDAQVYYNLFNLTLQQSFNGTLTFNADNTYVSNLGGQTDTGTWSMNADGTKLTLDSVTDPPFVLDVVRLTRNELEVNWTETGMEDINDDNIPETIKIEGNMKFTKQ